MASLKAETSLATVVGDVVSSRGARDRAGLHRALSAAVARLNAEFDPPSPLLLQAGDEFQGAFADVGTAMRATWRLRWALAGKVELRYGLGWGAVTVLEQEPRVEDGPGWWAARDAIEAVKADAARPGLRQLRTAYRLGEGAPGPLAEPINAALICRDQMVGSLSQRSSTILGQLIAGRSQAEIAADLGISASAVSQRVRGDGLVVIEAAQELLEGVR
ncbi:SatD family protein [Nocardioides sp.]|uniref:SatD family protein n=1 Tax=Nocardioides sp. TaxID=35761 RepID=UPI00356A29D1